MEPTGFSVLASLVLGISPGIEPSLLPPLDQISQATRQPSAAGRRPTTDAAASSALLQCSGQAIFDSVQCQGDGQEPEEARAMGIGIYRQYAVLWVGEDRDPVKAEIAAIDLNNRRIIPSEASRPSRERRVGLPRLRIRIR